MKVGLLVIFCVLAFSVVGVRGREPPPVPTLDQLECAFCVVALNELEALANETVEQQDMLEYLTNIICPMLSGDFKYICDKIADNIPLIFDSIVGHVVPGVVCVSIDICTSDPPPPPDNNKPLPVYKVNLDLPPEQRWDGLVNETRTWNALWLIANTLDAIIADEVKDPIYDIMDLIHNVFPEPYKSEITGISKTTGIPLGLSVLLNLFYELTQALGCTSIVSQTTTGDILWSRNQDLGYGAGFTRLLKNISTLVEFEKDGKLVYQGVTFAGYVGLPTVFVKDKWSGSVNARTYKGTMLSKLEKIAMEILNGYGTHVATWVVRKAAENAGDFGEAVKILQTTRLAAECYYILGGIKPGEGVVISRNLTDARNMWWLDSGNGKGDGGWFMAQTNYDHWNPAPWWDDRRYYAVKYMEDFCGATNGTKAGDLTMECLYRVLSSKPVLNIQTLYTAQGYPPLDRFHAYHRECTGDCAQ